MIKIILTNLIKAAVIIGIYFFLLYFVADSNLVAGVFCPGSHIPVWHGAAIAVFIVCRLYVVLMPGLVLARMGTTWLKKRADESRF